MRGWSRAETNDRTNFASESSNIAEVPGAPIFLPMQASSLRGKRFFFRGQRGVNGASNEVYSSGAREIAVYMRTWIISVLICLAIPLHAQAPKNVQILSGLSRPEIQRVMNQMRAGLGVHCRYCRVNNDPANDAKPQKARAREMMRMVIDLDTRHFGGQPVVTCFTCHNGLGVSCAAGSACRGRSGAAVAAMSSTPRVANCNRRHAGDEPGSSAAGPNPGRDSTEKLGGAAHGCPSGNCDNQHRIDEPHKRMIASPQCVSRLFRE